MQITNEAGLPQAIVRALEARQETTPTVDELFREVPGFSLQLHQHGLLARKGRETGPSDVARNLPVFRVSSVIGPPQIPILRAAHEDKITRDARTMIWSLLGTAMHELLERHAPEQVIAERRFARIITLEDSTIAGHVILTGKPDLLVLDEHGRLSDYKVTRAWAVARGVKEEWEAQTNIYGWMVREDGYAVRDLDIVPFLRDWREIEKLRYGHGYPDQEIFRIPVTAWSDEDVTRYLRDRLTAHLLARRFGPEPCTDRERWQKPTTYVARREGLKTAMRNSKDTTPAAAEAAIEAFRQAHAAKEAKRKRGAPKPCPDAWVEERPGGSVRCPKYCDVAAFCPQWQEERAQIEAAAAAATGNGNGDAPAAPAGDDDDHWI